MCVIIMQGMPGSGKGHWIEKNFVEPWVCSADHYFENPIGFGSEKKKYNFNPAKLGEAHGECLRKYVRLLGNLGDWKNDVLIVDNTNTTVLEMAPYVALAQAYKCDVEIVSVDCPKEIAYFRNTHGVPWRSFNHYAGNLSKFESDIPPYWEVKRTRVVATYTTADMEAAKAKVDVEMRLQEASGGLA